MPSTPWTHIRTPTTDPFVFVAEIKVPRLALIAMVLASGKIGKQLKSSEGLFGYRLKFSIRQGKLWTLSAWESKALMNNFVSKRPHSDAMKKGKQNPNLESRMARRDIPLALWPLSWQEACDLLPKQE